MISIISVSLHLHGLSIRGIHPPKTIMHFPLFQRMNKVHGPPSSQGPRLSKRNLLFFFPSVCSLNTSGCFNLSSSGSSSLVSEVTHHSEMPYYWLRLIGRKKY